MTPDQTARELAIMRARARALAAPRQVTAPVDQIDVVEFRLAGESCGIAARQVLAAIALREFTPLPRNRSSVVGLAEWRGSLLSLVDVRQLLGLPAAALADLRHVVIAGDERRRIGILVEGVVGSRKIDIASLRSRPAPTDRRFVIGTTPDALVVLDGPALAHETRMEQSWPGQ
jgi:purine-binding chemotaxis protein CheW